MMPRFKFVWIIIIVAALLVAVEAKAEYTFTDISSYDVEYGGNSVLTSAPADSDDCTSGCIYEGIYGKISSPNYPLAYPNNYRCSWTIKTPVGSRVAGMFTFFHMESDSSCSKDFLEVHFNGLDDGKSHLRLCGYTSKHLLSKDNILLIMFSSDNSTTAKGFDMTWKAVVLVSKGKPTKQSSVYVTLKHPKVSDLAVDGNDNCFFYSGSCTHTHDDYEPWWKVDLEKNYAVQFVTITNRQQSGHRLRNAEVRVGTNPSPYGVNPQCGSVLTFNESLQIKIGVDCGKPLYGRYVSVKVVGRKEYLTLCEVEVFGDYIDTNGNETVECSYSPGPCDLAETNCSFPSSDWPTCNCDNSMFHCDNGRCIPMMYRCNMYDNCGDASDEYSCECSVNDTVCVESRGSYCVESRFVCDGYDNCHDTSDEVAGCTCAADEYQCTDDNRCLPSSKLCDYMKDCMDGQDERNCVLCVEAEAEKLISFTKFCDGKQDCFDGRDERNCETPGCAVRIYGSQVDCHLPEAIFSTFNYPYDYVTGSRCTWYIEIPSKSSFIRLAFIDFDIPSDSLCQSDHVVVYNDNINSENIIGFFCNFNKPPANLLSSRNKMVLVFTSDGFKTGRGFQVEYVSESVVSNRGILNSSYCRSEWTFYENACYQSLSDPVAITWTDAKRKCENIGSYLVVINNEQEMEFIHYMLTHFWLSDETRIYIGLSNRLSDNGVYSWSNGGPLCYSAWYRKVGKENLLKNQPTAGELEQCTLIKLDEFHSLQQWHAVACEFPTTGQYLCKYQLDNGRFNTTVSIGTVEKSNEGCYTGDFQCTNRECIQKIFVCDGKTDCRDGSDEINCKDTCKENSFKCKNKQCIPLSFVCDFIQHCTDLSDETDCHYRNCTEEEFKCENGQCINMIGRCDLLTQCIDGSDEQNCDTCSFGFQCYDESCLPARAVCDATNDCPGGTVEDEINCDYWENRTCDGITCKNGECSPNIYKCLFDPNEYHMQKGCRDMSHLENCGNYECPVNTVKCPAAYCIAERLRCNGVWDCQNGEDEQNCDTYTCPNSYKCRNSIMCIPRDERCNGVRECPDGDDELFCGNHCPPGCFCRSHEVKCNGVNWNSTTSATVSHSVRYLNLTALKLTLVSKSSSTRLTLQAVLIIDIEQLSLLITADFSSNGIQHILPNTFIHQSNLRRLVLSKNNIGHLTYGAFNGLRQLEYLYINNNGLTSVDSGVFAVLPGLKYLDIQVNTLTNFQDDVFDGLNVLQSLLSDDFLLCCIVGNIERCDPPPDQFSSCEDLMKNSFLRVLMWILGISALIGNSFVIIWRIYAKDYRNVQSLLITNLAASDFLMGLYMMIIAGADMYYRGRYARFSDDWKSSLLCKFAGSISTLSSEFSVFILVVMSLDRAIAVAFPFGTVRLNRNKCLCVLMVAWLIIISISFLPMFSIPYFGERYYGRPSVCLALPLTGDRLNGWEFSIAIFLGFNLIGFLIIAISYIYIYISIKRAASSVRKNQVKSNDLKMATKMATIVFTDFCCWFPIILMGIASQVGVWQIPVEIYVWSATLIMPINSSINPYLYTIPYISDNREKKLKMQSRLTKSVHVQKEYKNNKVTLLDKVFQDVQRNRILPLLSGATSRPYLLPSLTAAHIENKPRQTLFTNEDLIQIEKDLKKALQFIHRNNMVHGSITEEFVVIYSDKDCKRAFLIDTPTTTIATTEGESHDHDFNQLRSFIDNLRSTKRRLHNGLEMV